MRLETAKSRKLLAARKTDLLNKFISKAGAKADSQRRREIELRRRVEEYLDAGHGECWLHRPDIARVVENALFHFDGQRYRIDFDSIYIALHGSLKLGAWKATQIFSIIKMVSPL